MEEEQLGCFTISELFIFILYYKIILQHLLL